MTKHAFLTVSKGRKWDFSFAFFVAFFRLWTCVLHQKAKKKKGTMSMHMQSLQRKKAAALEARLRDPNDKLNQNMQAQYEKQNPPKAPPQQQEKAADKACAKCGTTLSMTAKFCSECGARQ
jgi:hypothetical protein